jgi:hypothetical protein
VIAEQGKQGGMGNHAAFFMGARKMHGHRALCAYAAALSVRMKRSTFTDRYSQ